MIAPKVFDGKPLGFARIACEAAGRVGLPPVDWCPFPVELTALDLAIRNLGPSLAAFAELKRAVCLLEDFLVARLGGLGVLSNRYSTRFAPSISRAHASIVNTFSMKLPTITLLSSLLHLHRVRA
jgi:hypothetical protein